PLPDVARGAGQAVAVGGVRRHGGRREEPVVAAVVRGEGALPDVAHPPDAWGELVAPREAGAVQAAPCGVLPLGVAGQPLPGPGCVRLGVVPGDVHDGMVL